MAEPAGARLINIDKAGEAQPLKPQGDALLLREASTTGTSRAVGEGGLEFPMVLKGKRILLATESFGPVNGVSRTTLSLVTYLRQNGVQVAVVAPEAPGRQSHLEDSQNIELRLTGYPLPYNPELAVVYPFRIDRLCDRTFQPDLIYLASPASLGFQILLQLRLLDFQPVVLCNFQTDLSAYCEILFPTPLDKWAVWVFRYTQGYLFRHPMVHTVFYPSSGIRKYLEEAGVQSSKLVNLRRGVDTELFNPAANDPTYRNQLSPNGELILCSVSRLAPEKGFEFLSEVAHILAEKGFPFHLLIVGGNRNSAVEATVRQLFSDLDPYVTFTGFLEGPALARAYASSDVFVHSSITETFGLVVLEAMASGLPVIARDEGGPSEIVEHDRSGYLVAPTDVSTFIGCVEELGSNTNLRCSMAKEARHLAEQATWEKINNRVAWQLASALSPLSSPSANTSTIASSTITKSTISSSTSLSRDLLKPISSSLLLRRPLLTSGISGTIISLLIDAQITAAVGIIFGVWCGLILTWLLVQVGNVIKPYAGVAKDLARDRMPWFLSGIRHWRAERLREREKRIIAGKVHGTRRI